MKSAWDNQVAGVEMTHLQGKRKFSYWRIIMYMRKEGQELRAKQKEVLRFIAIFIKNRGFSPSLQEIMDGTGISTKSLVNYYVAQLVELGYLRKDRKISRSIRVVPEKLEEGLGVSGG